MDLDSRVRDGRGDTLLIQFARAPVPGAVKTRMQPHLTAVQACALHEELLLWTCRQLLVANLGPVELWVGGEAGHPVFEASTALGVSELRRQPGGDLGQRMYRALTDGLRRFQRVILVGSDCPELDRAYLRRARNLLARRDCVLGPAEDGGYVLIGASRTAATCFGGIDWGSARVLDQSVARLKAAGLTWQTLPMRRDIDRPDDLPIWEAIRVAGVA